jgi:diaminohydroxyphosphoribosylaminopyrimidine deaminase/5-amino-6-(5-phosphoribosylamino)uracil reductase
MTSDLQFMQRAVMLAKRATGRTSPNPLVGCVIVKNGKLIAEGWHKVCAGDHAEVDALKKAGVKTKGATMYVTLEPCAHWGRTPPCVDAVLAAGIKKIVVAMKDPNPLTNGKSIRKMRSRGLEVVTGVGASEARDMNLAFIKYISKKMPYVVAKLAQTMDGKAGICRGQVPWITSSATRARAREKRKEFDAIVVGVNTVMADDPGLNAPGKAIVKVVVDARLRMPLKAKLLKEAKPGQIIIATTRKASRAKIAAFEKRGAIVMACPDRAGHVDLKALFKELAKNGLSRILIEGGPTLVDAAFKAGLVDRLHVYIAPRLMSGIKARDMIAGFDIGSLADAKKFKIVQVDRMGQDLFIECDVIS